MLLFNGKSSLQRKNLRMAWSHFLQLYRPPFCFFTLFARFSWRHDSELSQPIRQKSPLFRGNIYGTEFLLKNTASCLSQSGKSHLCDSVQNTQMSDYLFLDIIVLHEICSTQRVALVLQGVLALMNQAIDPLLEAIQRNIENMLLRMHSEDFAR